MVFISPSLKQSLENTKKEIDSHSKWMYFVKNNFEYEKVSRFDKKKRASRAFYKMVEILRKWNIINKETKSALCLCEAPGGFIQAIQEIDSGIDVFGQSLPNSIRFSDHIDERLYEYSDLGRLENIVRLAKKAKSIGKYDLITGDGGIDVSNDYLKQESMNLKVIYYQILCMLYCLKPGGNFVLKIFDCFNKKTVQLLQILYNHFNNFEIVKPVLSRPCNSEKYVVCMGFRGYSPIPGFSSQIYQDDIEFNIPISLEFHNQIIQMNKTFVTRQIRNIREILDLCKGKFNARNINNRQTQLSKSLSMYNSLNL